MNLQGQRVKAIVQKQVVFGTVLKSKFSNTIETPDNPDSERVLIHKVKFDSLVNVVWDDVPKSISQQWVDDKMVEVV